MALTRSRCSRFTLFCYVWLVLGFFTGTLILIGPARWITSYLRNGGYRQSVENGVMIAVIVMFVAVSALIAWFVVRQMSQCATRRARYSYPLVLTIAALTALYAWTNPAMLASAAGGVKGAVTVGGGAEFVFGPYPDRARLQQLKQEGFTAVVSLQHPAVLPFEPPGIAEEIRATREIGLTFIHAPMLPWISDNDESLEKVRKLAHEADGRYYVHCGLGRDRANVVKRMLEREGTRVVHGTGFKEAHTFAMRLAEGNEPMERGQLEALDAGVFLIPYPNKHEMFGNMLSGQVGHVLVLLDDSRANEAAWISEARAHFTQFQVPYSLEPLQAGDDQRARVLARKAKSLPGPVVVIVPFMAPHADTAVADTFRYAWAG